MHLPPPTPLPDAMVEDLFTESSTDVLMLSLVDLMGYTVITPKQAYQPSRTPYTTNTPYTSYATTITTTTSTTGGIVLKVATIAEANIVPTDFWKAIVLEGEEENV